MTKLLITPLIAFLAVLHFSFSSLADSLTLYMTPARPTKVNWETPRALLWSALSTTLTNRLHSIGHINVHLECEATETEPAVDTLTGATSQSGSNSANLVLKQGSAIGVLFYDLPGKHETREKVLKDFSKLGVKEGRLASITFKIRPETCRRLHSYHQEYLANHYDQHYGLPNRPRYREGGGCSAFGASFVDVAGFLDQEMHNAWSDTVLVPEALVGYPITNNRVPYLEALMSPVAKRWALETEPHRPLFFYEPEYMYQWVVGLAQAASEGKNHYHGHPLEFYKPSALNFIPEEKRKAISLAIDMRDLPPPNEPIFLK